MAELDVILKSINLMEYTMTITSNRKRYPVKHFKIAVWIFMSTCLMRID